LKDRVRTLRFREVRKAMRVAVPLQRAAIRCVATVVSLLFCAQLSQFYLVVPSNSVVCLELNYQHAVAADQDASDLAGPLSPSHPSGNTFQHCKDTYDGMLLVPDQPFGTTPAYAYQVLLGTQPAPAIDQPGRYEFELAPPFHPPKISS
jgi:hypothetical protein